MQVESIKNDAIVDIKIGSSFYKDLQSAMFYLVSHHSDEEIQVIADKINAGKESELTESEKALETVMLLCTEIEERAREQGKTEMIDVPDQMV